MVKTLRIFSVRRARPEETVIEFKNKVLTLSETVGFSNTIAQETLRCMFVYTYLKDGGLLSIHSLPCSFDYDACRIPWRYQDF